MKASRVPEIYFRKDYEDLGFEIIRLESFLERRGKILQTSPHRIRFYAMLFIEEGEGVHYIDFKRLTLGKGSLLFIGKDQVHAWNRWTGITGYIVLFTERFLYRNQVQFHDLSYTYPYNANLYSPKLETCGRPVFDVLALLLPLMHAEYISRNTSGQGESLQCLLRFLILKIRSTMEPGRNFEDEKMKSLFILFQKALDQNLSVTRNVSDYCTLLKVSYHRLNRTVKRLTQKTAKAFIDDMLILEAKRHLAEKAINTSEISYVLGFEEPTNFTKFFKKYTGKTPKYFRDSLNSS
ncbi:MAG: helix-turn-helix transcriptional regulator [Bacteroidota bacterium]